MNIVDFNTPYYFYYDEVNNVRVFRLRKDGFNNDLSRNFILGGVVFKDLAAVKKLKSDIKDKKFNNGLSEIKVNDFCKKTRDIMACLGNYKTRQLLEMLLNNEFYIHYIYHDNLYYSLADIIDSVKEHNSWNYLAKNSSLKTELYRQVLLNLEESIDIFNRYNYPNTGEKSKEFYAALKTMIINKVSPKNKTVKTEELVNFLSLFKKDALYLTNNEDKIELERSILIDEYYLLYLKRAKHFASSTHVFDQEPEVERKIKESRIGQPENMTFVDSKDEILIQISDVIVGLISRLTEWVHQHQSIEDMQKAIENLDDEQREGYSMFRRLLRCSCATNPGFLNRSRNDIFNEKLDALIYR